MRRLSRVFSNSKEPRPVDDKRDTDENMEDRNIIENRSVDHFRPIRVVIIGSGLSGIIASIRLRQRISNLELCVYDKNEDIGGTWFENRYPGCACGVFFLLLFFNLRCYLPGQCN